MIAARLFDQIEKIAVNKLFTHPGRPLDRQPAPDQFFTNGSGMTDRQVENGIDKGKPPDLVEFHQPRQFVNHRRRWLEATAPIDRGWNTLLNLRSWAMVGSGLVAVWSVRHPRFLLRWTKRSLGIWSTWRMARKLLQQTASR